MSHFVIALIIRHRYTPVFRTHKGGARARGHATTGSHTASSDTLLRDAPPRCGCYLMCCALMSSADILADGTMGLASTPLPPGSACSNVNEGTLRFMVKSQRMPLT